MMKKLFVIPSLVFSNYYCNVCLCTHLTFQLLLIPLVLLIPAGRDVSIIRLKWRKDCFSVIKKKKM